MLTRNLTKLTNTQLMSNRLYLTPRRFNIMERFTNRKKDDSFKNEMNHLLNKQTFTLRDYKEKVFLLVSR